MKKVNEKLTSETNDDDDDAIDLNPVGLLQKRHSEPLHSHEAYLIPEIQPHSSSAARGCNPWTGQTADEIREAAYSEHKFQQMMKESAKAAEDKIPALTVPMSPQKKESATSKEHLEELDELLFDTAM